MHNLTKYRMNCMKLQKIHTPGEYVSRAGSAKEPARGLPFHPVSWGYSNNRAIHFDIDPGSFVVVYVLEGIAHYSKFQESAYVGKDNLIVSDCNGKMSFSRATPHWKFFYAAVGGTHAKFYYDAIRTGKNVIHAGRAANSLTLAFTDLCALSGPEDVYSDMHACYLVHQILHELLQITREASGGRPIAPARQRVVDHTRKYIEEHYREELTIELICQQMSFSKFYLCKLFKERTGQTLHQYLTSCRINKSREYLTGSKLPIHAIAQEVGFKNTLAYSRAFKQYMNMTPSEYREAF